MFYKYWINFLKFLLLKVYRINVADRKKAKIYDVFYPVYDACILGENIKLSCPGGVGAGSSGLMRASATAK